MQDSESECWNSIQVKFNEAKAAMSQSKQSINSTSLKARLPEEEKQLLKEVLDSLDKNKFWTLRATTKEAAEHGTSDSVEKKIMNFASQCNFHQ